MSVPVRPALRRATTLMAVGGLLVSACGSPEPTTATELDTATAAVLADAADRLGDALDADDHCRALAEADALEDRVRVAGESGDAPDDVLRETLRVAATLTADLRCEPADLEDAEDEAEAERTEPDPGEAEIEAPPAEGPADRGGAAEGGGPEEVPGQNRGQGRGQGRGQSAGGGNAGGGNAGGGNAGGGGPGGGGGR